MLRGLGRQILRAVRGVLRAIAARPRAFVAVTSGVFALSLMLPPVVLSVARRPWDYFTFNPWLSRLPEYLAAEHVPLDRKLAFLSNMALFWFSANGPYGFPDWGFAVDVRDVGRILVTSLLFGSYFALWRHGRAAAAGCGWEARASRRQGVAGALVSTLGLSTGPCSVVGCGAPVLPVVGLAFTGLTSGTLTWLAGLSRVATTGVLVLMVLGVGYLGWRAGATPLEDRAGGHSAR
jgi:hypothetical protein